jgi:hypothetical protein
MGCLNIAAVGCSGSEVMICYRRFPLQPAAAVPRARRPESCYEVTRTPLGRCKVLDKARLNGSQRRLPISPLTVPSSSTSCPVSAHNTIKQRHMHRRRLRDNAAAQRDHHRSHSSAGCRAAAGAYHNKVSTVQATIKRWFLPESDTSVLVHVRCGAYDKAYTSLMIRGNRCH